MTLEGLRAKELTMPDLMVPTAAASRLYRAMLLQYRVQETLRLGAPAKQLERAAPQPGETVVDWGCGSGRVTIPAAKAVKGGKVIAVDVERLALQVVREKAAREELGNIYTVLLQSHPVAIPSGSVDLVLLLDTFHAVRDKEGLLSDIGRVMKPGGRLFMDPGHSNQERTLERVEASGLFRLDDVWGRDMLFVKDDDRTMDVAV
jgi:ubiquinone/menaquinone biosynthesis C-methylase UbiE